MATFQYEEHHCSAGVLVFFPSFRYTILLWMNIGNLFCHFKRRKEYNLPAARQDALNECIKVEWEGDVCCL